MQPYPLAWPENMPRYKGARQSGAFRSTINSAMKNVKDSLRLFGSDSGKAVTDVVISSNFTLGVDAPADPGIAVWFKWDGLQICIPVDRYAKPESNLQAIHHILEARRTELRHGTLALVRATFTGFLSLPTSAGARKRTWREVLDIAAARPTASEIDASFRSKAKNAHPDAGGSIEAMQELNLARAAAFREVNS